MERRNEETTTTRLDRLKYQKVQSRGGVTVWVGVTELRVVQERYGWKLAGVQGAQGICQGVREREKGERVKRNWRFDSKY